MILYFTGTGNSRYAADYIAAITKDKTVFVNDLIKRGEMGGAFTSQQPFLFVCPAYAWRIPRVFCDFIAASEFRGSKSAYFIITCGSDIGNASKYAARLCRDKKLEFKGAAPIIMPENYVAMFDVPAQKEADRIIDQASSSLEVVAAQIRKREPLETPNITVSDRLKSGIVNTVFYPLFVKAKGFYSTDQCIGCGKCEQLCPFNNITIRDSRPQWGSQCTHCMACICRCPKEAIEYKKKSQGKERYFNDQKVPKERKAGE